MTVVVGASSADVTMPRGAWIPNPNQITDSGLGLLAVVGRGLDDWGLGEDFERRAFTHGDVVPLHLGDEGGQSQLIVAFAGLELGNAGEKQFQFQKGDIGTAAHMVGAFKVQLWVPWPTPTGGLVASLAADEDLLASATALNQCAWVTFSTLRALSLAGVKVTPPVTPIVQDGIIVGPADPITPSGGLAGFSIDVQLQYD